MKKIFYILLGLIGLFINTANSASLEILIPAEDQKIILSDVPFNIPVKGSVTPPEKLVGKIKWESVVENLYTTETNSDQEGAITVTAYPQSNTSFGEKEITAKAKVDVTLDFDIQL